MAKRGQYPVFGILRERREPWEDEKELEMSEADSADDGEFES